LKKFLLVTLFAALLSTFTSAQSTEIGVLAGGIFTSDTTDPLSCTTSLSGTSCGSVTVHTPTRISYEGVLAHRLVNLHLAGIHLELPVVGTPTQTVVEAGFRRDFSTVYFTPGLRLQLGLPFFSPFVSAGGGLAHYSGSGSLGSSTVGAFQVGGGFDLSAPIPFLHFRAEVREFHNGTPNFNVGQNNIFAGAGLVLKF
jgi:hypothetical protein